MHTYIVYMYVFQGSATSGTRLASPRPMWREAADSTSLAHTASCRRHWPGKVNRDQWEPRSAEPADAAGKQTGPARQSAYPGKPRARGCRPLMYTMYTTHISFLNDA